MKPTYLFLAFIISSLAFGQTKQTRDVCCFNSVEINGAFEVYLRMGDESSITVIADEDIIDNIITTVDNDELEVEYDDDWWDFSNKNETVKLYITLSTARYLEFNGACKVNGKNALRGKTINIECNGASKLNLEFDCLAIDMELSGASKATLSGTCRKVNIDASGASAIYAADLQTETMNMEVSGASKAEVNVSESLNVEASGASKVRYKGSPSITKDVSGASSISKL
jgi:hypothetical protein